MDRGAWQATVHAVAKSQTWLSDFHFHFQTWIKDYPKVLYFFLSPKYILDTSWEPGIMLALGMQRWQRQGTHSLVGERQSWKCVWPYYERLIDIVDVSHKWWDARRKGKKIFLGVFLHPSASLVTLVGDFVLEQDFVTLLSDGFWHPLTLGSSGFLCSFRAHALQWDLGSSHNAATI